MSLDLNTNGLLPQGIHTCTIDTIFDLFVLNFPFSLTRRGIFREWESYNQRLKQFVPNAQLVQWVNGSFVTAKHDPNDIDCVTFIPLAQYQQVEDQLIEFYTTISLFDNGLDAYVCPVYEVGNEPGYSEYRQRQTDWLYLFSQVRARTDQKGFLTITI